MKKPLCKFTPSLKYAPLFSTHVMEFNLLTSLVGVLVLSTCVDIFYESPVLSYIFSENDELVHSSKTISLIQCQLVIKILPKK
jgi:hypothetical protein